MSYNNFSETFSNSRKNLKWGEIDYIVEYMQKYSSNEPISVLDIGCGNGRFLETLDTSGLPYSYLGIDESEGMINEAKKLHPDRNFRVIDMKNISELASEKKYDFIVFIASFHHLHTEQERREVLENTKKLLKKGGIIMMTNWNLLGQELFEKYKKSHLGNGDFSIKIGAFDRYFYGFTLEKLNELFNKIGFDILENRVFEGGRNIISIIKN